MLSCSHTSNMLSHCSHNFLICTGPFAWIWSSGNVDTSKSLVPSCLPWGDLKAVSRGPSHGPSSGVPSVVAVESLSLYAHFRKSLHVVSIMHRWYCSPRDLRSSTNVYMDKKSLKMNTRPARNVRVYRRLLCIQYCARSGRDIKEVFIQTTRIGSFEKLLRNTS